MVGRKTSPRCDSCRKRKVKCDLSQPSCTQCVRKGLTCPGYDTESRFFVYQKQHELDSSSSSSSGELSDSSNGAVSRKKRDRLVVLHAPPASAVDSLRGEFVSRITHRAVAARFMVIPEQQVLQHLPRRLGSNRALDDAVKCICSNGSTMPGPVYSEALASLQGALNHPDQAVTSETLAAAILLQMFEHSVDHGKFRWLVHANGVISMIQQRGPSCIKNELDRSILQAQVGNIWFQSLQAGNECFLARPEWEEVVSDTFRVDNDVNAEWSAMIRSGLAVPGILCRYERFDLAEYSLPTDNNGEFSSTRDRANCTQLILDLWKVRTELAELGTRFQLERANELRNHPTEVLEQPRARHASRLAILVYSIIMDYMLENVLGTDIGAAAAQHDLFDMISMSGYVATSGRLKASVSAAQFELKCLRLADYIAATQTAKLSRMMSRKVLDAPLSRHSKVQYLTPIVENLYKSLAEDSCEDSYQPKGPKMCA